MHTRWRAPVALTTSVLLALFVYRSAERAQHPPAATPVPRAAALDAGSLVTLADLMRALVPTDDLFPPANDGAEALLAALRWSGFLSLSAQPEPHQPGDLSDMDFDGVTGLIGPAAGGPAAGVLSARPLPVGSLGGALAST